MRCLEWVEAGFEVGFVRLWCLDLKRGLDLEIGLGTEEVLLM